MRGNTRGTQLVLTHEIDIDIVRLSLTHLILKLLMSHRGDIIISSFHWSHFNSVWNGRLFKIVAMKTMGGKCKDIWRSVQSRVWLHKELSNASFYSCKKYEHDGPSSVTKGSFRVTNAFAEAVKIPQGQFTALWHQRRSLVYASKNFLDKNKYILQASF